MVMAANHFIIPTNYFKGSSQKDCSVEAKICEELIIVHTVFIREAICSVSQETGNFAYSFPNVNFIWVIGSRRLMPIENCRGLS